MKDESNQVWKLWPTQNTFDYHSALSISVMRKENKGLTLP